MKKEILNEEDSKIEKEFENFRLNGWELAKECIYPFISSRQKQQRESIVKEVEEMRKELDRKIKYWSKEKLKDFKKAEELRGKDNTQSECASYVGHQAYGQIIAYENVRITLQSIIDKIK